MMVEERKKELIRKKVTRDFYEGNWRFRCGKFLHLARVGLEDYRVLVHFYCGMGWVTVKTLTEHEYGIPDVIKEFHGEKCDEECLKWVTEKAWEIYTIVSKRTEPYKLPYQIATLQYERALKGN